MSTNKAEQAVAYAALILADEFIAITPEKLQTLLKAAGVDDVEPIWTALFAKALEGKNVKDILTTVVPAGRTGDEAPTQKSNEASDVDSDKGKVGGDAEDGSDGDSDIGMSLFD
jgi:large subunit ribosomal protein LP1